MAWTQYGVLGIDDGSVVDRDTYECGILGNKEKK